MPKSRGADGNYKVADDGITYVRYDGGDYKLMLKESDGSYTDYNRSTPDEFRVGKKAITTTVNNSDWNGAYSPEIGQSTGDWEEVEITEDTNDDIKTADENGINLVYKADYAVVEQIEDGVRGETNPKIKKLFLDDYYIYDGTPGTAALIEMAKDKVLLKLNGQIMDTSADNRDENGVWHDPDDPDTFRELFGDNTMISSSYKDSDGKSVPVTGTIDQISGPISLTHTSLSAFGILENIHTLDSEFIYHDFKELVVELDYFDKEDLVEAEDDVMMFPVAGVDSAGWPDTRNDKSEDYYGTLIHSAEDYQAERAENLRELKEQLGEEVSVTNEELAESGSPIERADTTSITTDNPLLMAAADISAYTSEHNYFYGPLSDASGYTEGLGVWFASSFEESQQQTGIVTVDCSSYVSWVLQEVGIYSEGQMTSTYTMADAINAINPDWLITDNLTDLQAGDIILESGHTQIYAGDNTWYNAGCTDAIRNSPQTYTYNLSRLIAIIRIPSSEMTYNGVTGSGSSIPEFEGFSGGEAVVAPVTGEVIKYGTVKRKNLEAGKGYVTEEEFSEEGDTGENTPAQNTTEEDDEAEVGFIKIKVLDVGTPGETCEHFVENHLEENTSNITDSDINDHNASTWLKDHYGEDSPELDKLGYDYFWEEYNDAGITGYILYIEGFDVSEILGDNIDEDASVDGSNIRRLKEYIERDEESPPNRYTTQYEVSNLLDDKREFQLKIAEAAKKSAAFTFKQDGKIYIKEGAVIGYTYTTEDAEDNGITQERKVEVLRTTAEADEDREYEEIEETNTANQNAQSSNETEEEEEDLDTVIAKYQVGNYLRVILRDLDDEVVENVEDYIEIGEGHRAVDGDWDQFLYWMGPRCEGVTPVVQNGEYFAEAPEALDDGMGVTAAFGITSCNDSLIEELGYSWHVANLNAGDLIPLEENVDVYLAIVDANVARIKEELGDDNMETGYQQGFVSILYNYGNLTSRGTYYAQHGYVPESLWTTYEGTQYADVLTKRRRAEWVIITEGRYTDFSTGDDLQYTPDGTEMDYNVEEAEPLFSYWCEQHGIQLDGLMSEYDNYGS